MQNFILYNICTIKFTFIKYLYDVLKYFFCIKYAKEQKHIIILE